MKQYYITTTLPYVNAKPHIGFALEIIQADVLARFHGLSGDKVVFNTGTDEHGAKIFRKAKEEGKDPQTYCDEYAAKFDALKLALNLSYTNFIRTTNDFHVRAAQEFWKRCKDNGDIYKKNYQIKYCVGCELEKTDSETEDGKCPLHPNMELELINEENYFFSFSKYQKKLLALYDDNPDFVIPKNRLTEIRNFVKAGLQDFSISRLKEKMPWGVPVPGDPEQVMYVWFDALINYISTIGWPQDLKEFNKFWPGTQVAGKDNLRQQSAMWQAMIMSAGLKPSKQIFIHGFIMSEGQKMSKSLGNVIDPFEQVKKYGTDALRYYLLGSLPAYDDGDFTEEKFKETHTSQLVNGIGNLTSRVLTMMEKYSDNKIPKKANDIFSTDKFWKNYQAALEKYNFNETVEIVNKLVSDMDQLISEQKPWEKVKTGNGIDELLYQLVEALRHLALALNPLLPNTSKKIFDQLGIDCSSLKNLDKEKVWGVLEQGGIITKGDQLFPRLTD